jgi:hypothetical protein
VIAALGVAVGGAAHPLGVQEGADHGATISLILDHDEQIAREILDEAKQTDAAEDELYGEKRGDELPAELATRGGRRGWLREAQRQLNEQRSKEARPIPGPRPERLKDAKRRMAEQLSVEQHANAACEHQRKVGRDSVGRRLGERPKPYTPPKLLRGPSTRPISIRGCRKMTQGWIQGYNAQASVNEQQIILAGRRDGRPRTSGISSRCSTPPETSSSRRE